MGTKHLHRAKTEKYDEYYTRTSDIAVEVARYTPESFRDKIVYCPCDGESSAFWRYFKDNFTRLGLKALWATGFSFDTVGSFLMYDGKSVTSVPLEYDGDFNSFECRQLMQNCDVVVTNPPFSLFRKIFTCCTEYGKPYLLVGTVMNAGYKCVWPYVKEGTCKVTPFESCTFYNPKQGKDVKVANCSWFSNLEFAEEPGGVFSMGVHTEDAPLAVCERSGYVQVSSTRAIPDDYADPIWVPVSALLFDFFPQSFVLLDCASCLLRGKETFSRVLVQRSRFLDLPKKYFEDVTPLVLTEDSVEEEESADAIVVDVEGGAV